MKITGDGALSSTGAERRALGARPKGHHPALGTAGGGGAGTRRHGLEGKAVLP
jgi:hypothetical protein